MNDERIREFLRGSLALWGVRGTVEAGDAGVVAVIRTADETAVRVERYSVRPERGAAKSKDAHPHFRWLVHSPRPRPCASIGGVLNTLRAALGVERGEPVRVVSRSS